MILCKYNGTRLDEVTPQDHGKNFKWFQETEEPTHTIFELLFKEKHNSNKDPM